MGRRNFGLNRKFFPKLSCILRYVMVEKVLRIWNSFNFENKRLCGCPKRILPKTLTIPPTQNIDEKKSANSKQSKGRIKLCTTKQNCCVLFSCVVANGVLLSGEWKTSFENENTLPVKAEKTGVVEILSKKNFYCCWDFGEETEKKQKNTLNSLTERQQI